MPATRPGRSCLQSRSVLRHKKCKVQIAARGALSSTVRPRISVMHIRSERPDDVAAISSLIERAFARAPHSSGCESAIVSALRKCGALTVSLVAEQGDTVQGHVAFSPVTLTDGSPHWYGLGPIAVEPSLQGAGIGSALIRVGLGELRALEAAGCVVLGEPGYYRRFGFSRLAGLRYPGPPPEHFLAQSFGHSVPNGEVLYHAAFDAAAYQIAGADA